MVTLLCQQYRQPANTASYQQPGLRIKHIAQCVTQLSTFTNTPLSTQRRSFFRTRIFPIHTSSVS